MKTIKIFVCMLLFLNALSSFADELISLKTRDSVVQKFLLMKPENPVATVVLFTGGKGILGLSSTFGIPSFKGIPKNFLVRTRDLFLKHGFAVAIVDAPSDKQRKKGMYKGFRTSSEHLEDIEAVITYLEKELKLPIWLIGTSRGTESVANIGINTDKKLAGLVLTSSMTRPNSMGLSLVEMDLEDIEIPTLIISHKDDGCKNTPMSGSLKIKDMLTNSKKVEFIFFEGGREVSKPCKAMSYHGFLGIEDKVIDSISTFIKKN